MHMDKQVFNYEVRLVETLVTYLIEVIDFKSEVRPDLGGCLEAVVASMTVKRDLTI